MARRRDDRAWIAIRVKARKLNLRGEGEQVTSGEMNKFLAAAANPGVLDRALAGGQRCCPVGRTFLLTVRHPGKKLTFPMYGAASWSSVGLPDLSDPRTIKPLAACWKATREEIVPQFRDGYTDVRRR